MDSCVTRDHIYTEECDSTIGPLRRCDRVNATDVPISPNLSGELEVLKTMGLSFLRFQWQNVFGHIVEVDHWDDFIVFYFIHVLIWRGWFQ